MSRVDPQCPAREGIREKQTRIGVHTADVYTCLPGIKLCTLSGLHDIGSTYLITAYACLETNVAATGLNHGTWEEVLRALQADSCMHCFGHIQGA